jgi:polygalacturonase
MKFHVLSVTSKTACFELENESVYYAEKAYDVVLNGKTVLEGVKENVFTLYELEPDTEYAVKVGEDSVSFRTEKASMVLHLKDFVNPGEKDDTLMIQSAIAVLPKGGVLYVDPGEYRITSLFLKSDMTLYVAKGAVIYGNPVIGDYPLIPGEEKFLDPKKAPLQLGAWEGNPFPAKPSFISAYSAENVVIEGEGVLDGQADKSDFWKNVKTMTYGRPRMLCFNSCKHVRVIGVTVENSPAWTIHPYFSEDVSFYAIRVKNPKDAPNTDGLDPECCSKVNIVGVYFSVGDDCIALKSGKIYIGKTYKKACEQVVIRNCYMHEGHGAVVLGSEVGAGVKDVTIERCYFEHTDRGLRIKTRRGRGKDSIIDNIAFRHIVMDNVLTPLVVNMFYFCDPDGHSEYVYSKEKLPVDDRTPYIGSFVFDDIRASDAEWALGYFAGLPERPIGSIEIRNSTFTVKKDASKGRPAMMDGIGEMSRVGFVFDNVEKVVFDNVKAEGYDGEKLVLKNVGSLIEK